MPTRHFDARQRSSRRCTALETATQVSHHSPRLTPVSAIAYRPGRARPAAFRRANSATKSCAPVVLKCHGRRDGDRGASAGDPRFTSSEAPPRAIVPRADIVFDRDSRPRVSPTAHARASPSVAPLRFSRFTQKTASVSLFSSPPASPRAFAHR